MRDVQQKMLDILKQKQAYYENMATMCDRIVKGESMTQVCKDNEISVSSFRGRIFRNDTKDTSYSPSDIASAIDSSLSPEERILKDTVDMKSLKDRIGFVDYPEDFEETVWRVIDGLSDEKIKSVLQLYYGEGWTFEHIGDYFGLSLERIRQILHKGIHQLRRKDRFIRIIYGDIKYNKYLESVKTTNQVDEILDTLVHIMMFAPNTASMFKQMTDTITRLQENYEYRENMRDSTPIGSLGLDIRTMNCLMRRSKIRTVEQLINTSDKELLAIPGFGQKCMDDLNECLRSHGYTRTR